MKDDGIGKRVCRQHTAFMALKSSAASALFPEAAPTTVSDENDVPIQVPSLTTHVTKSAT